MYKRSKKASAFDPVLIDFFTSHDAIFVLYILAEILLSFYFTRIFAVLNSCFIMQFLKVTKCYGTDCVGDKVGRAEMFLE